MSSRVFNLDANGASSCVEDVGGELEKVIDNGVGHYDTRCIGPHHRWHRRPRDP
jgi:hypothetical protein